MIPNGKWPPDHPQSIPNRCPNHPQMIPYIHTYFDWIYVPDETEEFLDFFRNFRLISVPDDTEGIFGKKYLNLSELRNSENVEWLNSMFFHRNESFQPSIKGPDVHTSLKKKTPSVSYKRQN